MPRIHGIRGVLGTVKLKRAGGYDPAKGPKDPDNRDPTLERGTLLVGGANLGPAVRHPDGRIEAGPHIETEEHTTTRIRVTEWHNADPKRPFCAVIDGEPMRDANGRRVRTFVTKDAAFKAATLKLAKEGLR